MFASASLHWPELIDIGGRPGSPRARSAELPPGRRETVRDDRLEPYETARRRVGTEILTLVVQLLPMLAILAIVAAIATRSSKPGRRSWKSMAEDLDLSYTNPWFGAKTLHGRRRGFGVRIHEVSEGQQGKKLVVKISGVDPGFTLGRDSALLRMVKPDIETGDRMFDQRTRIEGHADWALALLDDEARRLTEIVISGWNGELKRHVLRASFRDTDVTTSTLDTLIDLARLLRKPARGHLPKLLMERATHDSSNAVRLQALRRLASSYAFRDEALAAAEASLDASSLHLRFEACRLLVKSGSEQSELAAEKLATLATGHRIESSLRRSTIETLGESRHRRPAIAAMRQILGQARTARTPPEVRSAALEGLIQARARRELLEVRPDGEAEAEILARGLGRFDASVQPRLIELLDDSADRIRMAAVKSLGRVGDLDAIRPLRRVAGQDRLFKSALARESELAITQIKRRADGTQQGEISIIRVTPLDGAISPSDDAEAGGEVSLTS